MSSDWLTVQLSSVLDFPIPSEMIDYIKTLTNERDLEEYMKTLLDLNNSQHKKFLQELLQKRKVTGMTVQGGYKKTEVDYVLPRQTDKKKKGGKNQIEEIQESLEASQAPQQTSHGKKKSKYINLYSQEGQSKDVILLKGRHKCDCQASKHTLINNCLKCGRIVCEQEGSGPCLFCNFLVCSRGEQEVLNSGTKQSSQLLQKLMDQKVPGWEAAIEQRNRLLEYDRTSEKRTRVIDDESDYFAINSVWLSPQERERLKQREEEIRARRHRSRRDRPITLDIVGCRVMESTAPQLDNIGDEDDKVLQEISIANYENIQLDDINVDPTIHVIPKFEESVVENRPKYRSQSGHFETTYTPRIQDKEYLEMVDEGLCLSMHQPWASLLVAGIKVHEGRNWYTAHRGRLWIAATAKIPTHEDIQEQEHMYRVIVGDEIKFPESYPVSCLLGCVTVSNCLPQEEYRERYPEGESDSPFVFICEDPQELPVRFPIQGKHKIYPLDSKIHQAAAKCLQRVAKIRADRASKR